MNLRIAALTIALLPAFSLWLPAAEFIPLGDLPGGSFNSTANVISADGKVVAGTGWTADGIETFVWTRAGGMFRIGDLPGGNVQSSPTGISADGSVIAGTGHSAAGEEGFRWTSASGMVPLGDLPGGAYQSLLGPMTADGSTLYGNSTSGHGSEAVRWTQAAGLVSIRDFFGPDYPFLGATVSADGSTIAGTVALPASYAPFIRSSFLWNAADGTIDLNAPDRTGHSIFIDDLSADGSVAVGQGTVNGKLGPVRWTKAGGVQSLGNTSSNSANGISADGRVIFGDNFIWTQNTGIRDLRTVFTSSGIDLSNWVELDLTDVAADDRTFIGGGRHPDGSFEAWLAVVDVVPEPSSTALFAIAASVLGGSRRRISF